MRRKAGECRTFTEAEQRWTRENWNRLSIEALAAHLKCRQTVLKREAKLMGLAPRTIGRRPVKASELRVKRTYHKNCERFKDVDGERSSPAPTQKLYACPGCGTRATNPFGHAQCVATWTTDAA